MGKEAFDLAYQGLGSLGQVESGFPRLGLGLVSGGAWIDGWACEVDYE
ncbi:hypothetical protein QMA61_37410 [Streptomyces coelicoflavus]|nr:hypothetical protein [Streptomyces coelicoflavus]MDI6521844.1 hypothetical protein [Streptomyces coelicoflavus]